MQLLPEGASLREWGYTLGILSITTFFLVLNLPHITQWATPIRAWQDRMWMRAYRFLYVDTGLRGRIHRRHDTHGGGIDLVQVGQP